jgi:hypothetical protein
MRRSSPRPFELLCDCCSDTWSHFPRITLVVTADVNTVASRRHQDVIFWCVLSRKTGLKQHSGNQLAKPLEGANLFLALELGEHGSPP